MDNHPWHNEVDEKESHGNRFPHTKPHVYRKWWKPLIEETTYMEYMEECMCHLGYHNWTYEEEEYTNDMKRYCRGCHRIEHVERGSV